jgi:MFS family permease
MERNPRLIAGLLAAEICTMGGFAPFASLLVELSRRWHLNPAQAGWIGSAYLIGYAVSVPALVGMTDRIDSRVVYAAGCAAGLAAGFGFAWLASGFWSAFALRALAGASLAGTYIPGLRILTERLASEARIRSVPYYTSMFGVGASLSFWMSGWVAARYGWQGAFLVSGAGAGAAALLMAGASAGIGVAPGLRARAGARHPLDFRPVFSNREALAYALAYAGHSWEMFGFRAWLPAYLLFASGGMRSAVAGTAITNWATVITMTSVPASILGAELAIRGSRPRLIRTAAISSVVMGLAAALFGAFSFTVAVVTLFGWAFAISADSGALTAGTVAVARPGEQGATLAVYSLVGFVSGAIGPLAAGAALHFGAGMGMAGGWRFALPAVAAGSLLSAAAMSFQDPASGRSATQTAGSGQPGAQ